MNARNFVGHAVQVKGSETHRGGIAESVTADGWVVVREYPTLEQALAGRPGGVDEFQASQLEFDPT